MPEDLELTPRYKLVERIQQLEKEIRAFDEAVEGAVAALEHQVRGTKDGNIDKLIKMGLLGKDKPRRGRPPKEKKKRFIMSTEARAKISTAKKAYWAAKHAAKNN